MNECGRYKPESKHHSGSRYLFLPELMGNASCHPLLCTKRSSTHKISTSNPTGWTVKQTVSGYLDRDRWLKSMTQFSNVCGASPVNNQILFFDGHDSHFDKCTQRQMKCKNIQPFVVKSGKSINDQPNDNGPNAKLNSLYNVVKSAWILKYGTNKFSPHHMNSVLVES